MSIETDDRVLDIALAIVIQELGDLFNGKVELDRRGDLTTVFSARLAHRIDATVERLRRDYPNFSRLPRMLFRFINEERRIALYWERP